MRTALCLGGASCLAEDIAAVPIPWDGVVACNDAGAIWPGELDAWCSLHPDKLNAWAMRRREYGHAPAKRMVRSGSRFPGQRDSGTSGLFAAKVALIDLGFDRVVLCGIPMIGTPHFFDRAGWRGFKSHRKGWLQLDAKWLDRMRSMSGWTRVLLGSPKDWADGGHQQDQRHDQAALAAQVAAGAQRRRDGKAA